MKVVGIILIVAGVLMLLFRGISFTQEKEVLDAGPIEVNKEEKKTIGWPVYAGAIALIGGVALVIMDRKKV